MIVARSTEVLDGINGKKLVSEITNRNIFRKKKNLNSSFGGTKSRIFRFSYVSINKIAREPK